MDCARDEAAGPGRIEDALRARQESFGFLDDLRASGRRAHMLSHNPGLVVNWPLAFSSLPMQAMPAW